MSKSGGAPGTPGREPFGQAAVRKGFVTQAQVDEALAVQRELARTGAHHKMIGLIMLEAGALGTTELIEVLRDLNAPSPPKTERRALP
jgi:hypothetical protein